MTHTFDGQPDAGRAEPGVRFDFDLSCAYCSENLSGCGMGDRCPGCGRPVTATVDPTCLDEHLVQVVGEPICLTCGYNLRGLAVDGLCPECGKEVCLSLRSERLELADRRWLGRLRVGMLLIAANFAFHVVFLSIFLCQLSLSFVLPWELFDYCFYPLLAVVWLVGVFYVTSREPIKAGRNIFRKWRMTGRACALLMLPALIVQLSIDRYLFSFVTEYLFLFSVLSLFVITHQIAGRANRKGLAKWIKASQMVVYLVMVVYAGQLLASLLLSSTPFELMLAMFYSTLVPEALMCLLGVIVIFKMYVIVGQALRKQAQAMGPVEQWGRQ